MLNADREIVFFNGACESLTGCRSDEVLGLCCRYHGPAGTLDLPDMAASLGPPPEVMAGRPMAVQSLIVRANGDRLWRQLYFFPCFGDSGALTGVIGLAAELAADPPAPPSLPTELHERLLQLRDRLYRRFGLAKLLGSSASMARVLAQIRLAAGSDASVFVWGEPGTGKSLVARTIHLESQRRAGPFLPLDCALVPSELLERDLFGTDRLEFSAGRSASQGLLRSGLEGTLYLKNVSSMARDTQSRLARQVDGQVESEHREPSDHSTAVRMIAADVQDPAKLLAAEKIRPDLCCSLSTVVIALAPLRDRKEDLPLLAQMFVELSNSRSTKQVSGLTAGAIEILLGYDWPGNVYELGEMIAQAHERCESNLITANDVPPCIQGARGGAYASPPSPQRVDLDAVLAETERKLIEQAVKRARGNKSAAADLLSISRPRLYRRMQLLGMDGADELEPPLPETVVEPEEPL
jgi:DNA-binding NtrC family response regulator